MLLVVGVDGDMTAWMCLSNKVCDAVIDAVAGVFSAG